MILSSAIRFFWRFTNSLIPLSFMNLRFGSIFLEGGYDDDSSSRYSFSVLNFEQGNSEH